MDVSNSVGVKGVVGKCTIVSLLSKASRVASSKPGYQSRGCRLLVNQIFWAQRVRAEPLISTTTGYRSVQRKTAEMSTRPLNSSMTTLDCP